MNSLTKIEQQKLIEKMTQILENKKKYESESLITAIAEYILRLDNLTFDTTVAEETNLS